MLIKRANRFQRFERLVSSKGHTQQRTNDLRVSQLGKKVAKWEMNTKNTCNMVLHKSVAGLQRTDTTRYTALLNL